MYFLLVNDDKAVRDRCTVCSAGCTFVIWVLIISQVKLSILTIIRKTGKATLSLLCHCELKGHNPLLSYCMCDINIRGL